MLAVAIAGCGRAGFRDPPAVESALLKLHWGHVVYLAPDGLLYGWGLNGNGQLSHAAEAPESVWLPVAFEERFRRAELTRYATFLFDQDNVLWEMGNSGLSMTTELRWQTVAGGGDHRCGIAEDSSMWCWGRNEHGEIGVGHNDTVTVPTRVGDANDWIYLASAGSMNCGIRSPGALWCWGDNQNGQLAVGDYDDRNEPTPVGEDSDWLQAAGGTYHSCGLRQDGTLWCWGESSRGRNGLGQEIGSVNTPNQVFAEDDPEASIPWLQVATGFEHSCGLRSDGSIWCWGNAEDGRLGVGDVGGASSVLTPRRIGTGTDWIEIQAGGSTSCALDAALQLWCWGSNDAGTLGQGEGAPGSDEPVPVTIP